MITRDQHPSSLTRNVETKIRQLSVNETSKIGFYPPSRIALDFVLLTKLNMMNTLCPHKMNKPGRKFYAPLFLLNTNVCLLRNNELFYNKFLLHQNNTCDHQIPELIYIIK